MSASGINDAVKTLLQNNMGDEFTAANLMTYYPRTFQSSRSPQVVIWSRRGREQRFAGSGRSLGPVHGVKKVYWGTTIDFMSWGQVIATAMLPFEEKLNKMLEVFRNNINLAGLADTDNSKILNFGENMDYELLEPQLNGQFIMYRAVITAQVEEIYDA